MGVIYSVPVFAILLGLLLAALPGRMLIRAGYRVLAVLSGPLICAGLAWWSQRAFSDWRHAAFVRNGPCITCELEGLTLLLAWAACGLAAITAALLSIYWACRIQPDRPATLGRELAAVGLVLLGVSLGLPALQKGLELYQALWFRYEHSQLVARLQAPDNWAGGAELGSLALAPPGGYLGDVYVSPDGRRILLAAHESEWLFPFRFQAYDLATLTPVGAPTPSLDGIEHLRFSPDGQWLVLDNWGQGWLYRLDDFKLTQEFTGARAAAFSADSQGLAVYVPTAGLTFYAAPEWQPNTHVPITTTAQRYSLAFSPAGDSVWLATAHELWHIATDGTLRAHQELSFLPYADRVSSRWEASALSPDGRRLLVTAEHSSTAWLVTDGVLSESLELRAFARSGAFFLTNERSLVPTAQTVEVWQLAPLGRRQVLETGPGWSRPVTGSSQAWDATGERLAYSSGHGLYVYEWNGSRYQTLIGPDWPTDVFVGGLAFTPDGRLLIATTGDGRVHFLSVP